MKFKKSVNLKALNKIFIHKYLLNKKKIYFL